MNVAGRWLVIGVFVGIATAVLQPKEPQSLIAMLLLLAAFALLDAGRK